MENIPWLSDASIMKSIGLKLKEWRLEQNLSQVSLARKAGLSLTTVQAAEYGKNISFENLIRILRILGRLNALHILLEERHISPIEYHKMELGQKRRTRASKATVKHDKDIDDKPIW